MKQLQIKRVTKLTILGLINIFGVYKVSQPRKPEFSIMRIEFPLFVIEAPISIPHGWEKKLVLKFHLDKTSNS